MNIALKKTKKKKSGLARAWPGQGQAALEAKPGAQVRALRDPMGAGNPPG
jgi:hypothetical protein